MKKKCDIKLRKKERNKNKMKKAIKYTGAVILSVGVIAALACSINFGAMTYRKMDSLGAKVDKILTMNKDVGGEDGVVISDQYVIKSTKQISDAYISGDDSKLGENDKETLSMAKDVIKDIIKDGMSDYEKELAVYNWLTMYTSQDQGMLVALPTTTAGSDNPYGVLKNRQAVCVGYATTFRMFMQMLGIDCKVVHSSDLGHSWNLVKIDGEWYHTDVYSDAGNPNYSNFNMNDTMCINNHEWNKGNVPPATGTKYTYAYQNKQEVKDVYDIPKMIKKAMDKKQNCLFLSIGKEADNISKKYRIADNIMSKISNRLMSGDGNDVYMDYNWNNLGDDKEYVMCMYLTNVNKGMTDQNLSEKDNDNINKALNKAFGNYDWDNAGGDF